MTTYADAMMDLNEAIYAAIKRSRMAVLTADNQDGAPVVALRLLNARLIEIAADVDCLIDHRCTRAEFENAKALYEGAKMAGLTGSSE